MAWAGMRLNDSDKDYKVLEKIGEGAFGTVLRGLERASGTEVAIKRICVRDGKVGPAMRELNALRQCEHENLVELFGNHTHGANLVLVMPYIPVSLGELLDRREDPLSESLAATLARNLLNGLQAIHEQGLIHRDLKPHNILLTAEGVLKIADFGQARLLPPRELEQPLTPAVATRWYRAPELLFGAHDYGAGVDIWAAGCVIAQLVTLAPLLQGDSDIDQIFRVMQLLGPLSEETWPGLHSMPDYGKILVNDEFEVTPLTEVVRGATQQLYEVIEAMLKYDPAARLAAADVLQLPWVANSELRFPPLDRVMPPLPGPGVEPVCINVSSGG